MKIHCSCATEAWECEDMGQKVSLQMLNTSHEYNCHITGIFYYGGKYTSGLYPVI